jgi:hypothetical protein
MQGWLKKGLAEARQLKMDVAHLRAVKILDAYAMKRRRAPVPHYDSTDRVWLIGIYSNGCGIRTERHKSAAAARVSCANALAKEDPSLLEGLE